MIVTGNAEKNSAGTSANRKRQAEQFMSVSGNAREEIDFYAALK